MPIGSSAAATGDPLEESRGSLALPEYDPYGETGMNNEDDTEEWASQFTDDEWDSVVASANTGSSEDYRHLDGDEDE